MTLPLAERVATFSPPATSAAWSPSREAMARQACVERLAVVRGRGPSRLPSVAHSGPSATRVAVHGEHVLGTQNALVGWEGP